MGKLRVIVIDDGSREGLPDLVSTVLKEEVEVVGCLTIAQLDGIALTRMNLGLVSGASSTSSAVREAAFGLGQAQPGCDRSSGSDPSALSHDAADRGVCLTRTELEVLRLLAKGKRNKEIAREMYISINTVKSHVSRIFRKLCVKNRSEAVRYVFSRSAW